MIITRLLGGLGNQLFQYAAGLALAEKHGTALKLDLSWYSQDHGFAPHNRYALSAFRHSATEASADEIRRLQRPRARLPRRAWRRLTQALALTPPSSPLTYHHRHIAERFAYYPTFSDLPDETYLEGMWQDERFFDSSQASLRRDLQWKNPWSAAAETWAREIQSQPSASVHVRLGDYRDARFHSTLGLLSFDYYRLAIDRLRSHHREVVLYVFSDEIEVAAAELRPAGPHRFVRLPTETPADESLRLMSLCDHAVIANSTFGWWGAWIGPHRAGGTIIAPDPWHRGAPAETSGVVPPTWMRQPAHYARS